MAWLSKKIRMIYGIFRCIGKDLVYVLPQENRMKYVAILKMPIGLEEFEEIKKKIYQKHKLNVTSPHFEKGRDTTSKLVFDETELKKRIKYLSYSRKQKSQKNGRKTVRRRAKKHYNRTIHRDNGTL